MGKNTPDRQKHIIRNLRVEKDTVEELISATEDAGTSAVMHDIVDEDLAESA
jgi:topoisomerase-4 subunit B